MHEAHSSDHLIRIRVSHNNLGRKNTLSLPERWYNPYMDQHVKAQNEEIVSKLLSGTAEVQYQGKQVVVIGGDVFILPDDDREAAALVEDLEEQHPDEIPQVVFVPHAGTYVL